MAAARARLNLNAMKATHTPPSPPAASRPEGAPSTNGERRGQTLRLKPAAWQQLKILAIEQQRPSHDLLIEAVNLLFEHYDKPTIAG